MKQNFLELQQTFHVYNKDNRAEWIPGGDSLKKIINDAISQVYKRLINNSHYKEQNFKKADITFVNRESDLPEDFYIEYELHISGTTFYDYTINKSEKKLVLDRDVGSSAVLQYMPHIPKLVADGDIPTIEEHFHEVIPLVAAEYYHRAQLDWDNVARSIADAEDKLQDLINKYF